MKFSELSKLLCMTAAICTLHFASCKSASYEIIKGKKGNSTGSPNKVAENQPPAPVPQGPQPPGPGNLPPTARVETIFQGQSVVRVRVGSALEIRPSFDTVDADDVGRTNCANPGIVKAEYDLGREAAKAAQRDSGACSPLSVQHTFSRPGDYLITMVVTSNEGETATASMTLTVYDGNSPSQNDGGFTIRARPMIAKIGQPVQFDSLCTFGRTKTINWVFADGGTGTGVNVDHAYQRTGQYRVAARCTDETGRSKDATVTIVVTDNGITIPGGPGGPGGDDSGWSDGGNPGGPGQSPGGPGQNPGQNPGQLPGQNCPTNKQPRYQPYY